MSNGDLGRSIESEGCTGVGICDEFDVGAEHRHRVQRAKITSPIRVPRPAKMRTCARTSSCGATYGLGQFGLSARGFCFINRTRMSSEANEQILMKSRNPSTAGSRHCKGERPTDEAVEARIVIYGVLFAGGVLDRRA